MDQNSSIIVLNPLLLYIFQMANMFFPHFYYIDSDYMALLNEKKGNYYHIFL